MPLTEAVSQQVKLYHPHNPDPESLCGVMITDGKDVDSSEPMANVVVLPGQVGQKELFGEGMSNELTQWFGNRGAFPWIEIHILECAYQYVCYA